MAEVATVSKSKMVEVTIAATMGTTIDYFDFFIAGFAAAIVWPRLFFSVADPIVATALGISTYGLTFVFKPFGSYIFGHLGDRLGRKPLLFLTLFIMGIGTLGIAALPTYASIGLMAPIMLIILRITFGIGAGGEYGGAVSIVAEHSYKKKWRAFWASWSLLGNPIGLALGGAVFLLTSIYTGSSFLTEGWRIPFVFGSILISIAFFVRYRLQESPLFKAVERRKQIEKSPASKLIIKHNKRLILLALALAFAPAVVTIESVPFSLSYLHYFGVSTQFIFISVIIGAVAGVIGGMLIAIMADTIGRKPALLLTAVASAVSSLLFFYLINTLNPSLIILAQVLVEGSAFSSLGVLPIILSEYFPTKYRYSGVGLSNQFGALIGGLVTSFVTPALLSYLPKNSTPAQYISITPYIAGISAAICIISIIAILLMEETKQLRLDTIKID